MAGISVSNVDTVGGGKILPGSNTFVNFKGNPLAVVGSRVEPHGPGDHIAAVIETGSAKVFIRGIAVCMAGSRASCGHVATGQATLTTSS